MIADRAALALRGIMLRTARSPLKPLWAGLYAVIARLVALIVAPRRTRTNVYLSGSMASGEPLYGLSDIDLVAVAADEGEALRVRRRYEALCHALPPLRGLAPHFWTYDARGLARVLAGSYLVNGLGDERAVFLAADAVDDGGGLLERPGLHGPPDWRRLRGGIPVARPPDPHPLHAAWLELQYRWRYVFRACGEEADVHRPKLAVGLVAEAARIWLWLAHDERHDGGRAPLERALRMMDAEEEGLRYALEVHRAAHRSPAVAVDTLLACFVRISDAIAGLVDEAALGAGVSQVHLLGAELGAQTADAVALLDWRALALPPLDRSIPGVTLVAEERLVAVDDDPTDPAALMAAAARAETGRVPALRHGSLLIEPTSDVWGQGRLRLVQCRASDPVSAGLFEGSDQAAFPDVSGWSARDWARRAVAEHRAWLFAARNQRASPHRWMGPRPANVWTTAATLGLLLSAARSALFLESIEEGSPELTLRFRDLPAALGARDPGLGADTTEACAALDESRRERVPPPPELVGHLRRQVESLPAYTSGGNGRVTRVTSTRDPQPLGEQRFSVRRGTNISRWMSQTSWMTYEERSRAFTRDDPLRIRELGLDHVRLPVEERSLWHADGRRDQRGFDLLLRTIAWCAEAELAVVVCLHTLSSRRYLRPEPDVADLWRDLSEALADTPVNAVAYEVLNTPPAPHGEQWKLVADACVAAIRDREPDRAIVLGSADPRAFMSLAVPDDAHLTLTFNYYDPSLLTHYRASWRTPQAVYHGPIRYPGVPIPASELAGLEPELGEALGRINQHHDRTRIREDLALPLTVAKRAGQPLYCSEFGVIDAVPDQVRLRWYRDVIDALEEHEIAWSTWDLRGRFGLYSGETPTIVHRAIAERRFAASG